MYHGNRFIISESLIYSIPLFDAIKMPSALGSTQPYLVSFSSH